MEVKKNINKKIFKTHFSNLLYDYLFPQKFNYQSLVKYDIKKYVYEFENVLIPFNHQNIHWILFDVDIKRKNILLVDSLNPEPQTEAFEFLQNYFYLKSEWKDVFNVNQLSVNQKEIISSRRNCNNFRNGKKLFTEESVRSSKQTNSFDCGLFLIMNIFERSFDVNLNYGQKDMPDIRKFILDLILQSMEENNFWRINNNLVFKFIH